MALQQWALPHLRSLLPLDDSELAQIVSYAAKLPDDQAAEHLQTLLGISPESLRFVAGFLERRAQSGNGLGNGQSADETPAAAAAESSQTAKNDARDGVKHLQQSPSQPHQKDYIPSNAPLPDYASGPPAVQPITPSSASHVHTNALIRVSERRAWDEVGSRPL
jgi:hypothetical protein